MHQVFALSKKPASMKWNLEILLIRFLDLKEVRLDARDVEDAAVALAYLYHGPKASEVLSRLGDMLPLPTPSDQWSSEGITTLLWCMGVKYAWNEKLFTKLISIVLDHESGEGPLPTFDNWEDGFRTPAAACQLAWTLARCFTGQRNFTYVEHLGPVAPLPFKNHAERDEIFTNMQVLRFFRRLVDVSNDILFEMTFEALSQLLFSFAAIRMKDDDVISRVALVLGSKLPEVKLGQVQYVSDAMWALSILRCADNPSFDKCAEKIKAFSVKDLPIPHACNVLISIGMSGKSTDHASLASDLCSLLATKQHDVGEAAVAAVYPVVRMLSDSHEVSTPAPLLAQLMHRYQALLSDGKYPYPPLKSSVYDDVLKTTKSLPGDYTKGYYGDDTQGLIVDAANRNEKIVFILHGEFDSIRDKHGDYISADGYMMLRKALFDKTGWSASLVNCREWDVKMSTLDKVGVLEGLQRNRSNANGH